jgi:hypothetical protein
MQLCFARHGSCSNRDAPGTPATSDPAVVRASSLLEKGQATEAETVTRAFLKSHPDSAEAHLLLRYIPFGELHEKYPAEGQREGVRLSVSQCKRRAGETARREGGRSRNCQTRREVRHAKHV